RELNRLPDRQPRQHRDDGEVRQREILQPLERVVFSLRGVIAAQGQIEARHLPGVTNDSAPRDEIAPLAVQVDEPEIDQPVHDQQPHHREVPVAGARQPTAERQPRGDLVSLERVTAEGVALARERGIGIEDTQPAPHHDRQRDRVHPVGDADDRMMPALDVAHEPPRMETSAPENYPRRDGGESEEPPRYFFSMSPFFLSMSPLSPPMSPLSFFFFPFFISPPLSFMSSPA